MTGNDLTWFLLICAAVIIVSIVVSYIQIRVWTHFGEKFLLKRSNKLKKQQDEENKK